MPTRGRRRIDRILAPSFLEGIESLPLADLRARRAECVEEEALLSYERRLVHGRLDILRAELARRSSGDAGSLVDRLAAILSDRPQQSRGAFPREVPLPAFENPRRRVERLVSDDTLARLPDLPDDEVNAIVDTLTEVEREVSENRRRVQEVLDALTGETANRYQRGEADPADLLSGDRDA